MHSLKLLFFQLFFLVLFPAVFSTPAAAQQRGNEEPRVSPNASVSQTIGTTVVSIYYGRPSVNERVIFGQLVPFNEVWRTGANEATVITFSDDVLIEGEELKGGTYGLFTIPRKDHWTLIFNNVPTQWGAFNYSSATDALRVNVKPKKGRPLEQLMFYFKDVTEDSATVVLHWDETKVPFTIAVDTTTTNATADTTKSQH